MQNLEKIFQKDDIWRIGDGRKTNFWNDSWYKLGVYIKNVVLNPLDVSELNKNVSNYVLSNGDWDMRMLAQNLLDEVCKEIANIHIVRRTNTEDEIVWNHPKEAEFFVKSTYIALSTNEQHKPEKFWKFIWRWHGNQQTITFMWLCTHDKLLTNKQRSSRNPIVDPLCAMQ